MSQLYTRPEFRRIAGEHWRPGGTEITDRLLALGRRWHDAGAEGRILDVGCGPGGSVRHLRQQGRQVIYIVPKKGHEFRPLCEQIGGQFIRLAPSSKDCINIMAIRRTSLDAYSGLRSLTARDDSVLADKISRLIIFYSLLKKDLSDEDKNYLDASLVECYQRFGITFDNASLYDEGGELKEMPTIPDWYETLCAKPETKSSPTSCREKNGCAFWHWMQRRSRSWRMFRERGAAGFSDRLHASGRGGDG